MAELYQNNPAAFWTISIVITFLVGWFFWWLSAREKRQKQSQSQKQEQHVHIQTSVSSEDKKEIAKETAKIVMGEMQRYLNGWVNISPVEFKKKTFDTGIKAMDKYEWDKAIEIFRKLLPEAKGRNKVALLNLIGNCFYNQRRLDEALGSCKESLELAEKIKDKEGIVINLNNMGVIYDDKGDYDTAIKDYTKAIELNPQLAGAYNNRGTTYTKKGEQDKAIADYNKAIELNPKYSNAYSNRGNAYYEKGEQDKAIADYNKAIEINQQYAVAMANMGVAYKKKGNKEQARYWYEQALKYKESLPDKGMGVQKWLKGL